MNSLATAMTLGLILATVLISLYSRRFNATAADFYLAGRSVGFLANASAICGDYFSAASFLGVAAAVYAGGLDGAWFGAGFGAGFVPVVLFFAAPLRRFGEYTLPDFLDTRFQSAGLRLMAVGLVEVISLLYLIPQMLAVGQIWEILIGKGFAGLSPYATGVVVTTVLMLFYASLGGMRGTTWNQVVQFWVLLTAILALVGMGLLYGFHYGQALRQVTEGQLAVPAVYSVRDLPVSAARSVTSDTWWESKVAPHLADPEAEVAVLMPVTSKLTGQPMRFVEPGSRYDWLTQFSAVLTLIAGTSGLPHIMNRFYTNRSGPVARTTTVYVLGLVALFYILASMVGVMGRSMIPTQAAAGAAPAFGEMVDGVLANPDAVIPFLALALGGDFGLGYLAAGAFAAALSTTGGLLIASAASWGHDLYEQYIDPAAPEWRKVVVGRAAVVLTASLGLVIGLVLPKTALYRAHPALIALMVTWAFGVAGSGFFPVLFMAIWWRGTTRRGALAGMALGGGGAVFVVVANVLVVIWEKAPDWVQVVARLTLPAIITVPLAFLAIWGVSLLDRRNIPTNIGAVWGRIHGTARERMEGRSI